MAITKWMSWEGGVDLAAATKAGLAQPNVMLHLARMVHTPIGSAPSGMVLWQPDPAAPPVVLGFVSTDEKIARWFGPNIFAGTPFEQAPALKASIDVQIHPDLATARVAVGAHTFVSRLWGLKPIEKIERAPSPMTPFWQQGIEAVAGQVEFEVDGKKVALVVPPVGISGGVAAVWSPAGLYAR